MKKNWLKYLIRILAFVLVMYAIHTLVTKNTVPQEVVSPIPEATPIEAQVEFAVGYNCEDFEYLSVEVNGEKRVLCGGRSGGAGASASWYGGYFHGRKTASGEIFDENANTMACDSQFPLGTEFDIFYKGKTERARCTDRGGFAKYGRLFDFSKGLFEKLAPLSAGVIQVDYAIISNYDQQGGEIK